MTPPPFFLLAPTDLSHLHEPTFSLLIAHNFCSFESLAKFPENQTGFFHQSFSYFGSERFVAMLLQCRCKTLVTFCSFLDFLKLLYFSATGIG